MNDPITAALPPPETEVAAATVVQDDVVRLVKEYIGPRSLSAESRARYIELHGTLYRRDIRMNKAEKKAAKRRRHMLARKAHEVTA
jgi:hypothetical protein